MRLSRNNQQQNRSPAALISCQSTSLRLSRRISKQACQIVSQWIYATLLLSCVHIAASSAEVVGDQQRAAPASVTVSVQQQGKAAQPYTLDAGSRLSQLIAQIDLSENDYWYATAWLRPGQQTIYQAKKNQLLRLTEQQLEQSKAAEPWAFIKQQVSALQPTNRYTIAVHPDRVFAVPEQNYLLKNHDQLIIPARPSTVHITGFSKTYQRPHQSEQDINAYLDTHLRFALADKSYVWLIHPDTTTQRVPIAYWNKLQNQAIAPGSIIYVPLKPQRFAKQYQQINQLYLELLQNQMIGSAQGE